MIPFFYFLFSFSKKKKKETGLNFELIIIEKPLDDTDIPLAHMIIGSLEEPPKFMLVEREEVRIKEKKKRKEKKKNSSTNL